MRVKTVLGATGVTLAALAAVGFWLVHQRTGAEAQYVAPMATPPGITIQRIGEKLVGGPMGNAYRSSGQRKLAYGTAVGMTLYTYDKDVEPGKSSCTGECAKLWLPVMALPNAQPSGDWSLIAREDGGKQWARKGKPLYSFAKEEQPGDAKGDGVGDLWHIALYQPAVEMTLPYGIITVQEVSEANGQALADSRGMTLYVFDGDVDHDKQPACSTGVCSNHFTPFVAPALLKPVGDFSFVRRNDGTRQWAYKGKLLYTFDGDLVGGDVNGTGADKRWQVAFINRYFMPLEVSIRETPEKGFIFASAEGMTLYRLEGYTYQVDGHNLHRAYPPRPAAGRAIGWKSCVGYCLKAWHPLVPSADAQPSGYWEVAMRDDGTRQWVYQGYPMYTYAGDKKPGDYTGNDIFDFLISDDPQKVAYQPTPMPGAGALYWTYTSP